MQYIYQQATAATGRRSDGHRHPCYRPKRSAIREVGKALGLTEDVTGAC